LTTTPASATSPIMLIMLSSNPINVCPMMAPIAPKGIAAITMMGWT
jgi:hypothetical protein